MNNLRSLTLGTASLLAGSAALAQSGNMMGGSWGSGWMGNMTGGYGGVWLPILVIAVVVGIVVMVIRRK